MAQSSSRCSITCWRSAVDFSMCSMPEITGRSQLTAKAEITSSPSPVARVAMPLSLQSGAYLRRSPTAVGAGLVRWIGMAKSDGKDIEISSCWDLSATVNPARTSICRHYSTSFRSRFCAPRRRNPRTINQRPPGIEWPDGPADVVPPRGRFPPSAPRALRDSPYACKIGADLSTVHRRPATACACPLAHDRHRARDQIENFQLGKSSGILLLDGLANVRRLA